MTVRERLARRLRTLADRIDHPGAFRAMSHSFTFEDYKGIVFHEDDRGCRMWYRGPDYDRAHTPDMSRAGDRSCWFQAPDKFAALRATHPATGGPPIKAGDYITWGRLPPSCP